MRILFLVPFLGIALLGVGLHDRPQIVSMWMSRSVARQGDVIRGRVNATSNTASVEVRIGGYGTVMQKTSATNFVFSYAVPWLPPFLHGLWTVRVIARNVDGIATERDTSITLR